MGYGGSFIDIFSHDDEPQPSRSPVIDDSGMYHPSGNQSLFFQQKPTSTRPRPVTIIRLSIQPKTGRYFAGLSTGIHVYEGKDLDELAKAIASVGSINSLEMDSVGFDYQGNPINMESRTRDDYSTAPSPVTPRLKIVAGLSKVRCGGGRKSYIKGTEAANHWDIEDLAAKIIEYRIKFLKENWKRQKRTSLPAQKI